MNKRGLVLIVVAALLGVLYAYKFTDWFEKKSIQISFRSLPDRAMNKEGASSVTFFFARQHDVDAIKVFLDEEAELKGALPIWHVVAESGSVPLTDFSYGAAIPGLRPFIKNKDPLPLKPGGAYRVVVFSGKEHGEKTFRPAASTMVN